MTSSNQTRTNCKRSSLFLCLQVLNLASLISCTETVFYQDGKPVARFRADMKGMTYHRTAAGEVTWSGDIDHSTPTAAHGAAAQKILLATVPVITATGLPGLLK